MSNKPHFTMKFLRAVVGTTGPLKVDMGVYQHDIFDDTRTDEEKRNLDLVTICPNGEEITLKALDEALEEYNALIDKDNKLYNGRSYFWEGMEKNKNGTWETWWGS